MYYEYFGLTRPPFKITPDTAFFFEGGNRGAVLEAVLYAIEQGEGIIKVTGEVGSGKTMLCPVLLHRLDQRVDVIYLANPSVSPQEILHAIAFELALRLPKETSRVEVLHALQNHLVSRHAGGHQVVLFVEESQRMPLETLEEIRLLSNLETTDHKLLQIVLFGQPELDENLKQPSIRQLRERITHSFELGPLGSKEIAEYLSFRLRAAGYRGPALFSRQVVDLIAQASRGLTRRVNIIADKALLAAFSENTHTVTRKHIRNAVADSEFSRGEFRGTPRPALLEGRFKWWIAATLVTITALFGSWSIWSFRSPDAAPPPRAGLAADAAQRSPVPAQGTASSSDVATPPASPMPQGGRPTSASAAPSTPGPSAAPPPEAETADARETAPKSLPVRMAESAAWLQSGAADSFTIQILTGASEEYLRGYFRNLPKSVDRDRFFVYRGLGEGGLSWAVSYGHYANQRDAWDAMNRLPSELTRFRPYPRSLKVLRAEAETAERARVE